MTDKTWPAVVYLPTRRLHAVIAAGGPLDGSLYKFYTFCNRLIENPDQWEEVDPRHPHTNDVLWPDGHPRRPVFHCKVCQRRVEGASHVIG